MNNKWKQKENMQHAAERPKSQLAVGAAWKGGPTQHRVGGWASEGDEERVPGERVHGGANSTPAEVYRKEGSGGAHSTPDEDAWWSVLDTSGGMHGGANSTPAVMVHSGADSTLAVACAVERLSAQAAAASAELPLSATFC